MIEDGRLQADPPSGLVALCRLLLGLNGLFWGVAALLTVRDPAAGAGGVSMPLLVGLMAGNAVIFAGLSFRLRGLGPSVLIGAPIWTAVNLLLSLTDEVGLPDLVIGVLNAVTLALLLLIGAMWWSRRKPARSGGSSPGGSTR